MKTRTKWIMSSVAILLSCVLLVTVIIMGSHTNGTGAIVAQTRTVELAVLPEYENYLDDFEEKTITYDESHASFHGVMEYDERVLSLFDKVALADDVDTEQSNFVYDCSFDMDAMQFSFCVILLDENGEAQEVEEIVTDAFVTDTGRLDAYIELDGETYLISDFISTDAIDACLFGWLKALAAIVIVIIVVVVVVAETAEQIKAKSNYEYNKNLEAAGKGVAKGLSVTNQAYGTKTIADHVYDPKDYPEKYYPADYRFGFTTFGEVGCEVASVYNLLIKMGKAEMLSTTIYNFETWGIEFSIGFGRLGSNPSEIYRYLKKYKISYSKYTNYNKFDKALAKKSNCKVIMAAWNNGGMLQSIFSGQGLHTYYFTKTGKDSFDTFNLNYGNSSVPYGSLADIYKQGGDFIVAYIIG